MPGPAFSSLGSPEGPGTTRPSGAVPSWVTDELVEQTIRVWQPYYAIPLTREDAIEMIQEVGRLLDVLAHKSSRGHEKVRSPGPGQ